MSASKYIADHPVCCDNITYPATTSDLKKAMATVYNHLHRHETVTRQELLNALEILANCVNNENWTIYVP